MDSKPPPKYNRDALSQFTRQGPGAEGVEDSKKPYIPLRPAEGGSISTAEVDMVTDTTVSMISDIVSLAVSGSNLTLTFKRRDLYKNAAGDVIGMSATETTATVSAPVSACP